ncbi:FAD-dependent oxidoreductase [Nesterenkonia sp. E16_7]|uniref:flavin monoamine oxidase family protein n=1 Tax=unclassified Nesterenkonia TaxID=2629769 RepID=UPI001A919973|nr:MULTISPECIES: NAD(P)/FAD-dependent oxidoreductase [unclassified Nesterenkonia]MBO0594695.1 FAD-dependent oxidoreductase [Nesterenkonia sp. E16_10]MBO0597444.1 FAD-dependent oxidoreductase [Nesterenkonia sp. E16_7]
MTVSSPLPETPDPADAAPGEPTLTMLNPDFPFSYDHYLEHPAGLGSLPEQAQGTEVAVIGAGLAGVVAAYELMKLGCKPVIFEAGEIGGRLKTQSFAAAPEVVADLGGMRFPTSGKAFYHYVDLLDLPTREFPNPLTGAAPSTVIELKGQAFYAEDASHLPPFFAEVAQAWQRALTEEAELEAVQQAICSRDVLELKRLWNQLVERFDDESFYGFLSSSQAFQELSFEHLEAFGQVGFGSGGWDTDFTNSILEVLRVVFTGADDHHRSIDGGAQRLPVQLWKHRPERLAHWSPGTSLESLHGGAPRGAVSGIHRGSNPALPGGGVRVTEKWGRTQEFAAAVVTCQSWLLSARIDTDENLFAPSMWTAIEKSHYMLSSKTFVMVDRPFWRDIDPETGRPVMSMTLTDRLPRATYLLDEGPERPASILLSYTWNDDALKWLPLDASERTRLMLHSLAKIYPGVDIGAHMIGEPITVSWEADPNFMGAFKNNLPGHYRYQERLFGHFVQEQLPEHQRGVFLAGDDISFTAGWADGAVTTALNAVWGVLHHLGGTAAAENPGPGDVWADLAPIRLD